MQKHANDSAIQFTYREMKRQLTDIKLYFWLFAAVVILTTAAPFGTDRLSFLERFAYWFITAPVTFMIANISATLIVNSLMKKGIGRWPSYTIAGISSGIPVGIFVWGFDLVLNPGQSMVLSQLPKIILLTTAVTLPVSLLFGLSSRQEREAEGSHSKQNTPSQRFLDRLPKHLGQDIISLHAQDHYIKVVTTHGSEMILMRLSDAIAELESLDGFQTHRSWWVAARHVIKIDNHEGRVKLCLSNGDMAPISRSFKNKTEKQLAQYSIRTKT